MINGKYHRKRRLRWRREFVLVCSIVLLLIGMVGGSLAYLFMSTDPVTNTFTAPNIDVTIPEDFENGDTEKKNVYVKNSCDFEVYARATYVAYWQNQQTLEIYPEIPVVAVTHGSGWEKQSDGYWLYNQKVAANSQTATPFIVLAKLADGQTAPEGYKLVIDVIAEVVQANPAEARTQLWGY